MGNLGLPPHGEEIVEDQDAARFHQEDTQDGKQGILRNPQDALWRMQALLR